MKRKLHVSTISIAHFIKNLAIFIVSIFLSLSVSAQLPASLESDLQDILDSYYSDSYPYGFSASVYVEDMGYWEGTAGYSHDGVEMSSDMVLGIGSNTKLFTAVLCMKFQENDLLSLSDSIYQYLPQYTNVDTNITIKQLLQHNAGLDDYVNYTMPDLVMEDATHVWTTDEILSYVGDPVGEPGQKVKYSSTGYILAAMILEEISGIEWHTLVRDSILTPLGLETVYSEGFEEFPDLLAHPWHEGGDIIDTSRVGVGTLSWSAGCIVSTPHDMAKWYNQLFNTNFLSEQSIDEMSSFIYWAGYPYTMGIGIYKITHGTNIYWGHSGQTIGYNSLTYYNPENKSTISVIINDTYKNPTNITKDLGALIALYTNIPTIKDSKSIQVYPNPTNGILKINATQLVNLEIYNTSGVLIKRCNENEVDLSQQPKGIYYIKVITRDGISTKKILLN